MKDKIIRFILKIPASMMLVPMIGTSILNTLFPNLFQSNTYFINMFGEQASITYMCLILFFTGMQMDIASLPEAIKRGGSHVTAKYLTGAGFYLAVVHFYGMDGIFGVCSLALLCSLTNCNGSLYMGLMETYGDKEDLAARPMLNLNSGPALSFVTIGASGQADLRAAEYFGMFFPLLFGIFWGTVEPKLKEYAKIGSMFMLPCMAAAMGSRINLKDAYIIGFEGVALFLIVILVTGPIALLIDKLVLKRPGYGGLATVSVASNTIMVPPMIAAAAPNFAPYVNQAVLQITCAAVLSIIISPLIVAGAVKMWGCPKLEKERQGEQEQIHSLP